MGRQQPINIVMYFPKTEAGQLELSNRVATVHADAVTARLKALNCPKSQKLALLDAVIATVREKAVDESIHK